MMVKKWRCMVLAFFLFLPVFSWGQGNHYQVEPMSSEELREFLKEQIELVLHNFLTQEQAKKLDPYLDELVRRLEALCRKDTGVCRLETLSLEDIVAIVLQWQKEYLDGVFVVEGEAFAELSESQLSAPMMPKKRDECADIVDGEISMEYGFYKERRVQVFIRPDVARKKEGPVVFYWHGSNEDWSQVFRVLGRNVIDQITKDGGIVFVPYAGSPDALPWHVLNPLLVWKHNDFQLADQLLACAEEAFDIDNRRVYSMGFSAGGLQSAAMGRLRSNYIAAIASYSGGQLPWFKVLPVKAPNNFYPAFITYGTEGQDKVPFVEFADTSESLLAYLDKRGFHEVIDCSQERGHSMPYSTMQAGWNFVKNIRYSRFSEKDVKNTQPTEVSKRFGFSCR